MSYSSLHHLQKEDPVEKSQQRIAIWQERLRQWENSGKSGPKWAKDQQIPYHIFRYWRRKLAQLASNPFVELVDGSKTRQELLLEWQGMAIRLSSDFDGQALKRFLQIVQEMQC